MTCRLRLPLRYRRFGAQATTVIIFVEPMT